MNWTTIKASIKSKLEGLAGTGKPLAFVYDEHRTTFEGYPTATFEPTDMDSDFSTSQENMRSYVFRVIVHQEMESAGQGSSIDILASAIDAITDAFDNDYTLGGLVIEVQAVPARWGVMPADNGFIRYAELVINCQVLYQLL